MKKFKEINDKNDPKMPLSLKNYILLLAGLIVIILGFVLMAATRPTSSTTPCFPGAASRSPRSW